MRRLFWLIFLLGGYLWVLTSGHDDFLMSKAKAIYEMAANWISTAETDFQLKKEKHNKKTRRWE